MTTPDEIGENMTNRNAKNRGENSKDNRSTQKLCKGGITMDFSHLNKPYSWCAGFYRRTNRRVNA